VVYVIEGGRARQRVVKTGHRRDGQVEILSGLKAGERVAVDGAGFLTDGAAVEVSYPPHLGFRQLRPPLAVLGFVAETRHSPRYDSFPRRAQNPEERPRKTKNPGTTGIRL